MSDPYLDAVFCSLVLALGALFLLLAGINAVLRDRRKISRTEGRLSVEKRVGSTTLLIVILEDGVCVISHDLSRRTFKACRFRDSQEGSQKESTALFDSLCEEARVSK